VLFKQSHALGKLKYGLNCPVESWIIGFDQVMVGPNFFIRNRPSEPLQ
jgi:hypothetical protein